VLLLALGLLAELRDLRRSALAPYLRLLPAPPGSRLTALARAGPPATDLLLFTCGPARRQVLSQRAPAGRARAPAGCQRPPGRRGACRLLPRAQPDAVAAGRARRRGVARGRGAAPGSRGASAQWAGGAGDAGTPKWTRCRMRRWPAPCGRSAGASPACTRCSSPVRPACPAHHRACPRAGARCRTPRAAWRTPRWRATRGPRSLRQAGPGERAILLLRCGRPADAGKARSVHSEQGGYTAR